MKWIFLSVPDPILLFNEFPWLKVFPLFTAVLKFASPRSSLTVGEGISSTLTSRIPPSISPVQSHHPVLKLKSLAVCALTNFQTLNINPSACPQPQSQGPGNMSLLFWANHFSLKVHPPSSPQDFARSTLLPLASVFMQFFSPGSFLLKTSEQKGEKETFIFAFTLFFIFPCFHHSLWAVGLSGNRSQSGVWDARCHLRNNTSESRTGQREEKPSFGPGNASSDSSMECLEQVFPIGANQNRLK